MFNPVDNTYHELLADIRENGFTKGDRTGTGTQSVFGRMMRFDLSDGKLPLITKRKIFTRSFLHETIWFISGSTDIGYLKDNNVSIWDSWVDAGQKRFVTYSIKDRLLQLREVDQEKAMQLAEQYDIADSPDQLRVIDRELHDLGYPELTAVVVRPDTRRWRPLTSGEIKKKIIDRYYPEGVEKYTTTNGCIVQTILEDCDPYDPNLGEVTKSLILSECLENPWYFFNIVCVRTDVDDQTGCRVLEELYRTLMYDEPHALAGGSIGTGAYGAQWRGWDDTREITMDEWLSGPYAERGYTLKGDYTDFETGVQYAVIRRKIDQLQNAIDLLRTNPDSRRILVVTYNPSEVENCSLPPCHSLFQFWTRELTHQERSNIAGERYPDIDIADFDVVEDWVEAMNQAGVPTRELSCFLYCRSQDSAVGTAFNVAQYGVLTHMVAQCVNMVPGELVWVGGDVHIYDDHKEIVDGQLELESHPNSARLRLTPGITNIDDFKFEDLVIENYVHGPVLKYPIAV